MYAINVNCEDVVTTDNIKDAYDMYHDACCYFSIFEPTVGKINVTLVDNTTAEVLAWNHDNEG